jgi:DNA-binding transcriptional regulator GbsR (MarR family)
MSIKKVTDVNGILVMYAQGQTIFEISTKVGLSRQRVHQILKREGAQMRRRGKPKGEIREFVCKTCDKKFFSTVTRVFCSQKCTRGYFSKKVSPKERAEREEKKKESARSRAKKYYHEVFKKRSDWKSVVRERNIKNKRT